MFIASVIVSALLALATAFSGFGKLTGNPQVVEPLTTKLGVPARLIPVLGSLLVAGAVGTVAGIWWAPIGIAATACFVLYFLGAIITHARAKDWPGLGPVVGLMLFSAAALVLRLLSL
ncbi:DoxX-like protein [Promicromonospora sp. AC04]|uniref:DoxX family protein n=1 Tax=Promicromonospora sp. AC04 TaxID=2135723 RepID=UPI000D3B2AF9|nr:DoxX family protein [Promicromonospora sp. AC04]PUB28046.1 DoxX-like protein [Promicromonospora sp. AC04]